MIILTQSRDQICESVQKKERQRYFCQFDWYSTRRRRWRRRKRRESISWLLYVTSGRVHQEGHCLDTDHRIQYTDSGYERSPQSQQSLIYDIFSYYVYVRRAALLTERTYVMFGKLWHTTDGTFLKSHYLRQRIQSIEGTEFIVRWESTCVCRNRRKDHFIDVHVGTGCVSRDRK